jgi:tetratricopeptide (TPR) repeat protein
MSWNRFKKAIEAYKKAIEIKADEDAYYNMGLAYTMLNEKVSFEEAIKAYKKAIGINSDKDEASSACHFCCLLSFITTGFKSMAFS